MKKTRIFFGSIAIAALVSGLLGIIGCGGDAGGGGVASRMAFNKNAPPLNLGIGSPPGLGIVSGKIGGTTKDEDSFKAYTALYESLGPKVDLGITPTDFSIVLTQAFVYVGGQSYPVFSGAQLINFASPVTINIDDVEAGTIPTIMLCFDWAGYNGPQPKITFPLPGDLDPDHPLKTGSYNGQTSSGQNFITGDVITTNTSVTVKAEVLAPVKNRFISPAVNTNLPSTMSFIIYHGTRYFADTAEKWFNCADAGLPGSGLLKDAHSYGVTESGRLVIPASPIVIPSGTSSVTFQVSWELTNIIEQYQGYDNTPNTADDVFVLKNNFWEGLSISYTLN